ncbi:MAG TPA: aldo/keto reductase [Longimicrobiales bacterium]
MDRRPFGATGLTVPAIGMGTWQTFDVRGKRAARARREVVDAALRAGMNLFDTSPMYGESPRVLAAALDGRREQALVADKVWTESRAEAREQVRRSLGWYGTIDIYQVHNLVAWRDHLSLLEDLRDRGLARVIGVTHYRHAAFPELMTAMRTGRIQMIQVPYNAADRVAEREVLPLAQELGMGVLVMQPLGSGELVRHAPPPSALEPLERYGVRTWAQALLKWVVSDARVHCAIPATSSVRHAEENAAAGDPPWFDEDARAYVAELATGTGRR